MQVTVEALNPVTKKVSIEIPSDQVDAEIEKVYSRIQKQARIQGFRQGKAPMHLVKRTYSDSMRDEVMRRFYDQTLFKALDEHKIEPVEAPTIESEILEQGTSFKYSALVEVMPEIELRDYSGLAVTKEKYVQKPESIEGELKRMQENMAQLVPVDDDAAVENGHKVTLDYTFSVDGFPEETSNAEDAEVEVGENKLVPGFEEQLIGLKRGETREITITLPEGYRTPEAAGKPGVFQVTIKEIKRKELPELDDEFAQQFGENESMEQLRAKLAEYHEKHELERIENDLKENVIQALIEKNPLEVPKSMVKRQLDHMLENFRNRLKGQGMSLEMMGLDEEGFRQRFRDSAENKVKGGLLLMALVEKENISANDEDFEQRYEQIAAGNPDMLNRVKEYYHSNKNAKNALVAEIKEDKAIRFLLDSAVITETEPAEQKAA
ncbi:trigger factor [Geobacter sp. SVR]|uniref:trigger factor n=1 Tax=Geobacter sp. SVR TaxID=2495594 RepID=UPI00143F02D4|nr:trigger factor [Geobacter sp. SVR]BCS53284.1 trigger factor [Geobacter sp. SVR]GCF85590.1 trigger factor [Geobacter sp. SVR]